MDDKKEFEALTEAVVELALVVESLAMATAMHHENLWRDAGNIALGLDKLLERIAEDDNE